MCNQKPDANTDKATRANQLPPPVAQRFVVAVFVRRVFHDFPQLAEELRKQRFRNRKTMPTLRTQVRPWLAS